MACFALSLVSAGCTTGELKKECNTQYYVGDWQALMKSLYLINLPQLALISCLERKLSRSCSTTIKKLKDLEV